MELLLGHGAWKAMDFPGGAIVKNPPANAGEDRVKDLIPGSGRSPAAGNGNPLQYSCLENSTDRGAWRATVHEVAKSRTWLNNWAHITFSRHVWVLVSTHSPPLLFVGLIYSHPKSPIFHWEKTSTKWAKKGFNCGSPTRALNAGLTSICVSHSQASFLEPLDQMDRESNP